MVATSPIPRRLRTPSWLDLRLVVGVALVIAALGIGAFVTASAGTTRRVWAVARDLDAGSILTAADLEPVSIRLAHGTQLYVPSNSNADADVVVGKAINRQLNARELLPRAVLVRSVPAMTMTVPLTSDQAPEVAQGQRITLWVSTKTCPARVVVAGVVVVDVDSTGAGSFGTSSSENVVVRLAPDDATRVITALDLDGAVIRAGVVSGGPPSAPQDLAPCGAST